MKILETANGARQRARIRGLPADEDLSAFALELYRAQGGCCALSGLPFNVRVVGSGKAKRPFAPSLDRIDGASGYTRDNVRLVCQAVDSDPYAEGFYVAMGMHRVGEARSSGIPGRMLPHLAKEIAPDGPRLRRARLRA